MGLSVPLRSGRSEEAAGQVDWEKRCTSIGVVARKVTRPAPTTHSSKAPNWPKVASTVIETDGLQQPLRRPSPNHQGASQSACVWAGFPGA